MNKEDVVYVYIMEYYSAIKKQEMVPCDNMDGPWGPSLIYLLEIRQRKTNTVCSHFFVETESTEFIKTKSTVLIAKG